MTVRAGRTPLFEDALSGSGGMADPRWSSSPTADIFPDALSAAPLGGAPLVSATRSAPPVTGPAVGTGAVRVSQLPPRGRPVPLPPPRNAGPPRPLPAGPVPGKPAQLYVPVTTSAQLIAGSSRRPTAGTGYTGPRSPPGQIRPPAYLPQGQGMAQVRSAIAGARAASTRQAVAARSSAQKSSGAWSFVVLVVVLLVSTGAGQKIISLVSELLQRR